MTVHGTTTVLQGRWAQSIKDLEVKLNSVVYDVLLSAGTIAYCGPFTGRYRQQLTSMWTEHCQNANL